MFAKYVVLVAAMSAAVVSQAFEQIPWASAKALGVTRGKRFSSGLVFINGKYVDPPYVVERWGTGIRINSMQVTGQVIDWVDFIKTQDSSRQSKTVQEPAASSQSSAPPPPAESKSDADALDDLFDDNPAPAKPTLSPSAAPRRKAAAPKPKSSAKYELVGDFVKNDASNALVRRINEQRTEIDGILRRGGFIFFGDGYSRVAGDSRTAESMLAVLPELMQRSEDVNTFRSGIRSNGMVYINEILSGQLFNCRIDYRRLQDRRQKIKNDREWSNLLNDVNKPLL